MDPSRAVSGAVAAEWAEGECLKKSWSILPRSGILDRFAVAARGVRWARRRGPWQALQVVMSRSVWLVSGGGRER